MCYEISSCVETFLDGIGLQKYVSDFKNQGFDRASDLSMLCDDDLDIIGISNLNHRRLILNGAKDFQRNPLNILNSWLYENGLDYYFSNFLNRDLINLEDIKYVEVDKDLCDELEIVLPGHKKRFKEAVAQLRKRKCHDDEEPLAVGHWGVPENLDKGQNLFLLLEADLKSKKSDETVNCEFMIDTGSDVVTITDDIFQKLDLEMLGLVTSEGIHDSKKSTKLYSAVLIIGKEEVEVEVLRENHNSIGNLAFRHFRHYITGNRHHWLKGDYRAPSLPYLSAPSTPTKDPESIFASQLVPGSPSPSTSMLPSTKV